MLKATCPGSTEIRNPFPESLACGHCGHHNEIWSDEPETTCDECGKNINRDMKTSCLKWCPAAKECVGTEKYEKLSKAMKG